ncbi:MAG: DASS family sodium-coupled anion symporter, partial [Gammaproteobacteria bacterium]|nr:DASS family sodium-coupled anion symporter [Gammaproteobacteria bacterium]
MLDASRRLLTLVAGPLVAVAVYLLLPEEYLAMDGSIAELAPGARGAAAVAAWMALWWITDVIPVYVTAMLPLALFPPLGTATIADAAGAYGNPMIFLFFGGFILALALERWGLHRRVALSILRLVGSRPDYIVGAFMGIAAFISLWVTNTATTLLLLPVAVSVVDTLATADQFGRPAEPRMENISAALLLGVAYAASIGGMGSIIGTAPNVFVASFINSQLQYEISFLDWMMLALPLVLILLLAAWLLLTRGVFRLGTAPLTGTHALLDGLAAGLGPVTRAEKLTAGVFLITAAAWVFRSPLVAVSVGGVQPFAGLTDAGIAISAAILLFVLPSGQADRGFLMDWPTAARVPWGLLLLFGGGLSLAASFEQTGLANYIAAQGTGLDQLPAWVLIMCVATGVVFLSEIASNLATATTVVPVLASLAIGAGLDPVPLVLAACFAASCGFMLPVATPPNAIIYGTGRVSAGQMARAGFLLNVVGIL